KWDTQALRDLYPTVKEWFEEAYTGDWIATYESYYGKDWQMYGDEFEFEMRNRLSALIREQFVEQFDEAEDEFGEEIWCDIDNGEFATQELLTFYIEQFTTAFLWEKFEESAYKQIADEQNHSLHRQKLANDILNWWKTTFPNLQNQRIEKPDYKSLMLEPQLDAQFKNFSHEWLEFIASNGIRGNFSNSVERAISEIAKKMLFSEK
ncbi:MAG TPA: hypothetical protein PLZ51_01415, partial [Aggregatilineales bacterium]|nr:hypothetical protein [Aggregatilineales bacterium]